MVKQKTDEKKPGKIQTYYYVDFENTQDRFGAYVKGMKRNDYCFIFFSSDRIALILLSMLEQKQVKTHFVYVPHTGKNAVDFVIMTELGRQSLLKPNVRHVCISNDTGFDAGIQRMRELGMMCERISAMGKAPDLTTPLQSMEETTITRSVKTTVEDTITSKTSNLKTLQQQILALPPKEREIYEKVMKKAGGKTSKSVSKARLHSITCQVGALYKDKGAREQAIARLSRLVSKGGSV